MTSIKVRVIFIASLSHSGSTLLDLMLNAHPELVSVGELKQLSRYARFNKHKQAKCTCGKLSVWDCDFWKSVNDVTNRISGKTIADLNVEDYEEFVGFQKDNVLLFKAIAEVSSKHFIVDFSKSRVRLHLLLNNPELDVLPILLIRNPKGQICSMLQKSKYKHLSIGRLMQNYVDTNRRVYRLIKDRPHHILRYEDLVTRPEDTLGSLMQSIGLSFDLGQLNWAAQERHNVGGNDMRQDSTSELMLDDKWRHELTLFQKLAIDLGTIFGRYPAVRVSKRHIGLGKN